MHAYQVDYWKLQEQKRTNKRHEEIDSANADTNRLNYFVNSRNADINAANAETNRLNYGVNLQNAQTNARNADTNERNASINAWNAATNARNADTNYLNYEVNLGNLGVNQQNAVTNRLQVSNSATQATAALRQARVAERQATVSEEKFALDKEYRPREQYNAWLTALGSYKRGDAAMQQVDSQNALRAAQTSLAEQQTYTEKFKPWLGISQEARGWSSEINDWYTTLHKKKKGK